MVRRKKVEKEGKGWKSGPKTKYDPDQTPKLAYKLSLLGMDQKEIANVFQISIQTLELWIRTYPVLAEKLRNGRDVADAKVAAALFKKATGYVHEETYVSIFKGQVIKVPYMKYFPPDTAAGIFWLKNRTRDNNFKFSERMEVGLTKEEEVKLDLMNTDLSDFNEDELAVMKKITSKLKQKAKEE